MSSMNDMVYISVESRKGGVGKTTTALTLADALLEKGYQVLMIDMDIVGTTIDSFFINANAEYIHEVKLAGTPVNLVRLFKEFFMAGKNVPVFALEAENKKGAFTYSKGKCNFIGSNIYEKNNGTVPLEDPRILYDAYHAYWLLEFVKGISKTFAAAIGKDTKVAVVLDNSPGFSSIENGIHDFITDLGPEQGKVLLVTTIDPQDIKACRQSKSVIQTLFDDKVAAGRYYRSMVQNVDGGKRESKAFDTVWNSLCASDGHHPEYHAGEHEKEPPFINILVNKVPQIIFEQIYAKGILHRESEEASPFQNHLLYYFSNPQLMENNVSHQLSYAGRLEQYRQSGDIMEIESDDARYLEASVFFHQQGLGDFLKDTWAPKACFRDVLETMNGHDLLRDEPQGVVGLREDWSMSRVHSLDEEVKVVERFVMNNLKEGLMLREIMPLIENHVASVLSDMDEKAKIDFHPDHPKLEEIADFVTSFGLSVYRLHIYGQVSEMFNGLIGYCLEDVENLEKINKGAISSWIEDVLEGRVVDNNMAGALMHKLNDRKNARELRKVLQVIIHSWEL